MMSQGRSIIDPVGQAQENSKESKSGNSNNSSLEFYKQQYEKLLHAAILLANESYGEYVDQYEALTEGFWSESDLTVKLRLPGRWNTSDAISKKIITYNENQGDRELRIKNDKKWTREKIYKGEFHTFFENHPGKYFVPNEKRKDVFYATVNAMCASSMMKELNSGGKSLSTVTEYKDTIKNIITAYKAKKDLHKPKNEMKNYKKQSEKKSYQDYIQEQKKNPVVVFFELTVHAVFSILNVGITLDCAAECQKTRGHLRFWDKVTDDLNNTVKEVEAAVDIEVEAEAEIKAETTLLKMRM